MAKPSKKDLEKRVILAARQYGIGSVLFRNVVSKKLGVNVTDMECLGLLFHKGLATPTELARYTRLSSGATTAMLDRLENAGLIVRQPNPDDRRGTLIAIDKAGAKKIAPWFDSARSAQDNLVSNYSENQLRLIADFFEQYVHLWEDERLKLQQKLSQSQAGDRKKPGEDGFG